jgi:hypothetical protein
MKTSWSFYFLFSILIVQGTYAQKASGNPQLKPIETTVCQILENPSAYNNKLVKVRGSVWVNFEYAMLSSEGCSDAIWFALADGSGPPGLVATVNGNGKPGGKNSKGAPIAPVPVRLIRDANFERFLHYMNVKAEAKPCFNNLTQPSPSDCGVDRVTATFTGRIDGVSKKVHQAHLRRLPNEKQDFRGFGQMGMFDAQLVVQSVEDVLALDSFGREKP